MEDAAKLVVGYLIADVSAPKQPSVHLSEAQLQPLSGYYEPTNPEFQSFAFLGLLLGCERVFVENGRLYRTGFFGKKEALIPVSDFQFRLEKEPEASMVFTLGEDGTPVLTGAHFYCKRKVSTWWPPMRLAMVLGGLLAMLSSPLFALVWVPRKVLGRMRGVRHLAVRIVPLFATLSFVDSVVAYLQVVGSINPGERAAASVAFWVGTWAFAALLLEKQGKLRLDDDVRKYIPSCQTTGRRLPSCTCSITRAACEITWRYSSWRAQISTM
jgi:hypothetical protein